MDAFHWVLIDEAGDEMRSTVGFSSRAEAEEWLSGAWSGFSEEGAASVSLRDGNEEVYLMSLAPE